MVNKSVNKASKVSQITLYLDITKEDLLYVQI